MTDGQGRTVDFKNTILIMTSNLGSQLIMDLHSEDQEEMQRRLDEVLRAQFKPEFLNRIDEIITFHGLSKENLAQIVDIQFGLLQQRLTEQKLTVTLSDEARTFIINVGYDPTYGARPLKRAIQRYILDDLALELLEGKFQPGDTIEVVVIPGAKKLGFQKR